MDMFFPVSKGMGTHNQDFHVLKCYMEILHMGDHVVPLVKAWYKLTWRFAHRHLFFFKDTYAKGS